MKASYSALQGEVKSTDLINEVKELWGSQPSRTSRPTFSLRAPPASPSWPSMSWACWTSLTFSSEIIAKRDLPEHPSWIASIIVRFTYNDSRKAFISSKSSDDQWEHIFLPLLIQKWNYSFQFESFSTKVHTILAFRSFWGLFFGTKIGFCTFGYFYFQTIYWSF